MGQVCSLSQKGSGPTPHKWPRHWEGPLVHRDIVVVGASAGGVEALSELVAGLPESFSASLFAVLHVPNTGTSVLPRILGRVSKIPVAHAVDGMAIERGRMYVAPPDAHLILQNGHLQLYRGPRENGHRPAVDPLFRSAARSYTSRVIGVILSGALDDGTLGLMAVKAGGGVAVVQDPRSAAFPGMPESALQSVDVDYTVPLSEIPGLLGRLVQRTAGQQGNGAVREDLTQLVPSTEAKPESEKPGMPSVYTCPDCHGTLWEMKHGDFAHYECRVGHAYSPDALYAAQTEALEAALWIALRSLEERQSLAQRMMERAVRHDHPRAVDVFRRQMEDTRQRADVIRSALLGGGPILQPPPDPDG